MKKQTGRRPHAKKLALKREIVRQLNAHDLSHAHAGTWLEATPGGGPPDPRDCLNPIYSA